MAKFSSKFYEFVAEVLKASAPTPTAGPTERAAWAHVLETFSKRFVEDNPRFDPDRFRAACVKVSTKGIDNALEEFYSLPESKYGLVQVSERRHLIVEKTGSSQQGDRLMRTPSLHPVSGPLPWDVAQAQLKDLQDREFGTG